MCRVKKLVTQPNCARIETAAGDDDVDQPRMSARESAIQAGDDTEIPVTNRASATSAISSEGEGFEWEGEAAEYSQADEVTIAKTKAIASFWCVCM